MPPLAVVPEILHVVVVVEVRLIMSSGLVMPVAERRKPYTAQSPDVIVTVQVRTVPDANLPADSPPTSEGIEEPENV